jgi:hypothetical protein
LASGSDVTVGVTEEFHREYRCAVADAAAVAKFQVTGDAITFPAVSVAPAMAAVYEVEFDNAALGVKVAVRDASL